MLTAAQNDEPSPLGGRWPRASERRHFRGAKCVKAVEWLRNKYPEPEAPVRSLLVGKTEKPGWGTTAENLWRHMPALPMSLPAAAE
jgi:hypothetical protein